MLTLRFDLLVLWENPGYNMCIFCLLRIGNLDLHLQRIGIRTYSASFVIASIMRNSQLVYWFESSFNTTNLLVNRLKTLPKMKATREQVKIITLYGILKSGVATSTSKVEVYMGSPNWYPFNTWESLSLKVSGMRTAGGKSQPRCASGGCSVYRRNALSTSIVRWVELLGGRWSTASNVVGREWGTAAVYEMSDIMSSKKIVKVCV